MPTVPDILEAIPDVREHNDDELFRLKGELYSACDL